MTLSLEFDLYRVRANQHAGTGHRYVKTVPDIVSQINRKKLPSTEVEPTALA